MAKFLIPNTTQVPNVLLDVVMPQIGNPLLRVLLVLVRKTYGWGKESDAISVTQFMKLTGLSHGAVTGALREARERNLVTAEAGVFGKDTNIYRLNYDIKKAELVHKMDPSKIWTRPKTGRRPVHRLDTHKLKIQNQKKGGAKAPLDSSPIPKGKKLTRAAGIPAELQPTVSRIVARINDLAGTHYRDDRPEALRNLLTRLREGRTEAECLAVVEGRHAAWAGNDKMQEYFRPSTLFAAGHFEDYLQDAERRGKSNGHSDGPPRIAKRDGDTLTLADGSIMPRGTYERRYRVQV